VLGPFRVNEKPVALAEGEKGGLCPGNGSDERGVEQAPEREARARDLPERPVVIVIDCSLSRALGIFFLLTATGAVFRRLVSARTLKERELQGGQKTHTSAQDEALASRRRRRRPLRATTLTLIFLFQLPSLSLKKQTASCSSAGAATTARRSRQASSLTSCEWGRGEDRDEERERWRKRVGEKKKQQRRRR
jgi:hypothetical protein